MWRSPRLCSVCAFWKAGIAHPGFGFRLRFEADESFGAPLQGNSFREQFLWYDLCSTAETGKTCPEMVLLIPAKTSKATAWFQLSLERTSEQRCHFELRPCKPALNPNNSKPGTLTCWRSAWPVDTAPNRTHVRLKLGAIEGRLKIGKGIWDTACSNSNHHHHNPPQPPPPPPPPQQQQQQPKKNIAGTAGTTSTTISSPPQLP